MPPNINLDLKSKPKNYFSATRPDMLEFIPQDARKILEVGCGEGGFAKYLKQSLSAEVWGAELDAKAAASAAKDLDRVLPGDITKLADNLPDGYFDCIIFNDVLEHLADPFSLLLKIKPKLSAKGVISCSIPNIRYFETLKDLILRKQWRYVDQGILDNTHLRFFTKKSIIEMFTALGYKVLQIKGLGALQSLDFKLMNLLFLGWLSDTRYVQFGCMLKPND